MSTLHHSIVSLVTSLKVNRTIPKYQFGRASEPLLALFLGEALEHAGFGPLEYVVPEFPLKKENNQSTNIDHAFKLGGAGWLLVEVKTDAVKPRPAQVQCYEKHAERPISELIKNLTAIHDASRKKAKYRSLIERVDRMEPHTGNAIFLFVSPHTSDPFKGAGLRMRWLSLHSLFADFESRQHPELWSVCASLFRKPGTHCA